MAHGERSNVRKLEPGCQLTAAPEPFVATDARIVRREMERRGLGSGPWSEVLHLPLEDGCVFVVDFQDPGAPVTAGTGGVVIRQVRVARP